MTWNEDKYERADEIKRMVEHNCMGDRENCDNIHPNTEKMISPVPPHYRPQDKKPAAWRNWVMSPKVGIFYMNQHTLKFELFNVSEAFAQMSTNGKLNVIHNIVQNCLDDNERSMFFSDLQSETI